MSDGYAKTGNFKISWDGFKDFENLLDEIDEDFGPKDTKQILRNACRAAMIPVLDTARSLLETHDNIDTGQLLASLQVEARPPNSKDKRSEYSTPTMIMISRVTVAPGNRFIDDNGQKTKFFKKTFKNKKTGTKTHMHSDARAFAIEFGTARWEKGEGMPFIRPALESNATRVTGSLGTNLGQALLKYKSKHISTK